MNKKEILMICFIICFIFSLQAVVAADADLNKTSQDSVLSSTNVSAYALPSSDNYLTENANAVSFSELSNDLNSGDTTIVLTKNYTYRSSDYSLVNGINLPTTITKIDGQGKVIIDASNQARIFNIDVGHAITLTGITFVNANAIGNGGSINALGAITIENCNFINNTASGHGGAIYLDHPDASTITSCDFTNNIAGLNGGAIDWSANSHNGIVRDSTFTNNTANRSGGAIHWSGHYGTISNSNFTNNNATGDVVSTINGVLGGGDGGAVIWVGSNGTINNDCRFINNTAAYRGGAIFLHGNSTENCTNVTVDNCYFEDNDAGLNGGAINWQKNSTKGRLLNSIFINNTAACNGGAVFWYGINGTVNNCNFTDNSAFGTVDSDNRHYEDGTPIENYIDDLGHPVLGGSGGAIGFDIGATNGTIKNSKFFNNTAARDGGAIFFAFGSINGTIYNSTFDNNTAKRNGGAFCWDGTGGNVTYCNFTGNKALGVVISTEYAVLTSLDDVINVTGADEYDLDQPSTATDNKLYVLVIYEGTKKVKYELYVSQVTDYHFWLKIDETTETGPSPIDWAVDEYFGGDGGSIYWGGDNGTIDHCKFIDSDSARRGGGAYMTGGDHVNYYNCTFENCTSGTNGGGLDWLAGANYGRVIDCNFTHTEAARSAGAIYYDGDYGEFKNIIIKNTTAHGGDIYQSKYGKVTYARWDSSHWDTNTTGGDGGAIMFTGNNIKVYNANITDCTAAGRGGAVFLQDNDNVTFELCRFENNRALGTANNTFNDPHDISSGLNKDLTGNGGAISFDIDASESSIINSTFINNTAVNLGGAVHFREGASKDRIINSTFETNYVDEDGGALYLEGDDCELHNSTFTDNYAGDDGGAIFWKGGLGTIYNITCVNNSGISSHGNSKGGTICLNANNISLSDSSFKQSYAKVTGGALFVTGNYVNITGSEFEDCNVTTETGGAIQILGDYVQVCDSTFNECHAPDGGAIYVEGEHVKIIGSEFTNNNVTKDGAALYVKGDYSELHNSTFKDNVAGDDGGAIYWESSHGTIYNITCENNSGVSSGDSNSNGGTICLTGNDVTLSESSFKDSYAGADGGAIFVTGDNVKIISTGFENCTSVEEGGAIYVLGDDTTITDSTFENCNATQGGAIYVEGDRATISVNITDTHALGADSYGIVVDYKLYKDNVKEIKYDIDDAIKYVATIKTDDTFTNETIEELNTTLNELYAAVDNILTDDGINTTNVTRALDIVRQLNERLAQINASLSPGKDKNITLQLISDMENIGNELNYLIDISKTLEIPASVTAEIDDITAEVNAITPGDIITDANKTALISTLDEIRSNVEKMLDGNTFNATNIERTLELLNGLTDILKELNATLPNGNDKNTVINLLGEVKDIENQLSSLSDMVVVPEVVSRGGAIYISGNEALIDGSVINSTDAVYGGGLYISGHDVKVDNSEFINLYSTEDGGAIYITGQRGNLYNSKFINNTAGDDGGAINWDGNNGKIYNITCENNRGISFNGSSSNGGTISLTGNNTSIEKSSFAQTYALISGGAIFVTGNGVNITDSEFKDCNVSMNISETHKSYANGGGAIYVLGNSSNIVSCTFEGSEAREGGAIYVQGRDVTINKSNFTDSTAFNGGTIYIHGDRAIVIGCILNNTIAGDDSHALFDENLDVSAFEEGLLGKGGAIYIKSENAQILDTTITLSNATFEGGAIYVEGNNATISVDFVDCGAGYPIEWVTPDRDVFKPLISNILIRVNGLIAYNNDINNGFSDNFTNIYNLIYSIREKLVDKIFSNRILNVDNLHAAIGNLTELSNAIPLMVTDTDLLNSLELSSLIQLLLDIPDEGTYNSYYYSKVKPVYDGLTIRMNYAYILGYDNSYLYKRLQLIKNNLVDKIFIGNSHTFNAANLNAAIGNLTEVYDCVKYAENDGSYDEFLNNLSIAIGTLQSIPSDATYSAYDNVRKTASNNINSLMTYSRSIKNNYVAYKNNLNTLKTKLNNLPKQTTLREFNRAVYDISVIINNIEANLDLLLDVYAGNDLTDVLNNFTYVKSQITLIQNAGESLQNLGVSGGAIYVAGDDTNITGSTFLRCLASNALKGEGGAIYITGANTTITGSDFMNCSAPDNGGSIYVNGTNAKVEKSTFNITTAEVGGAIYILGSETTIDSSSFVDSSADYRGGAIYIEGLKATVKDSNFTDSEVTGGIFNNTNPRGGAIYIKENYATVEGSIFNNSSVSTTVGDGGAIYIEGDYAKILGSEFEYSSAHVGGAIYLEGDSCNVSESTFTYSLANENGGAMYSTGSKSTVYNSNFTNNLAELSGGGVYWFGGSKSKYNTVDGCIFTNNTAHGNTGDTSVTRGGGAIYWSEGGERGTVKNSEFYYNSVQSTIDWKVDGGAVLWDKSSHALVDNCTFIGNFVTTNGDSSSTTAASSWAQGGAMYLRPNTNYTVRNCLFENCSSSKEAGALYIQGQNSGSRMILLENSVFKNNVAYANGQYNINGGGAIQIKQCYNAVFNNLTFINNTANKGGALCVYDSVYNLVVTGANFTENKANRGSAISASVTFTLNDAVLLDNRADTSTFDLTLDRAGSTIDILLEGKDNRLNAMYVKGSKSFSVTCNNVTYWTDNNISIGKTNVTSSPQSSGDIPVPEAGISITVELFDANNNKLNEGNDIFATDANGELHLIPSDFGLSSFENVYVKARLTNENYYTQVEVTTRLPGSMEATAHNVTYHRNATVNVTITPSTGLPAASGNVSVYYGDVFLGNITVNDNEGISNEILTNITADKFLEVGTHNLTLKYWGDLYNDELNITVPINVTKAQSNITIVDFDEIGYDIFIRVTIVDDWNDEYYADATGNVTLNVYGHDLTTPIQSKTVYLVNGTGTTFFDLLPANYTIKATYKGDKNYNASVNSTTVELHPKQDIRILIDLDATAGDIMVDDTVDINVTIITPEGYEATGNVTLYLDNVKYILPLNDSKAKFNKTGLPAGFKIVTVCYEGSRDLQANYGDANFTVYKYNTTFTINVTNITHDQKEIINVTFLNETEGVVYIYVNDGNYSAIINNRTAIFELSNLTVGEYNVTVKFPGDWKFNNVTNMTRFYVKKVVPDAIIDVDNVTYGNPTNIIINVPDCVSGNISIKINGTPYGNPKLIDKGRVEFNVGILAAGNYTVEAIYDGDVNHNSTSYKQNFSVHKANRNVDIQVKDIVYGDVEHIEVYVNASGNVTITVNGKSETIVLNESGKAALDVYNLSAKTYTVDVVYNGNDNYTTTYANKTFTVSQIATTLDVKVHDVPIRGMEYMNITVLNSTGGVATNLNGILTINVDGVDRKVNVVNGTATFNSSEFNNNIGKRVVWVFFDGDVNFKESRAMKTYQVTQRTLTANDLNITAQNITVGQTGNVTVNLPKDITGYVVIEVKAYNGYRNDTYYKEVKNGEAVVYPEDLREGKYHAYVTYKGTDYKQRFAETLFTVSKVKVNVTIDVNDTVYDNTSDIVVYVDDGVEGAITIKINNTVIGTFAIVDGKVNTTVQLGAGKYTVYAEYEGNYKYNANKTESKSFTVERATPVITINPVTVDADTNATIIVRINDTATGNITITVNGTKYNATIENGVATFTINKLLSGSYNITAEYIGDNNYTSADSVTVENVLTIIKVACYQINVTANDTKVDLNTTIVVKVPADATGNVSVYVDGDWVGNATISQGVAELNVTKPYGNHTVNVTFTDGKYGLRYATTDYWVFKHDSPIVIDVDPILVGETAYINVTAPSDNVTIEINGESYNSVRYENGIAYFEVSGLAYGNKTVTAIYGGSDKYVANSTTENFTVSKRNSQLNVTATGNSVGSNATISVNVTAGATGYVVVNVNGTNYTINLTASRGSINIAGLGNGTYYVHATYIGDDNYLTSTNITETFEMVKSDVVMNITVESIDYGTKANITVNITSDATGFITIRINETRNITLPIGNGKVNWIVDGLAADNYTVYANYSGDGKYNINNTNKVNESFEVRQISPDIRIVYVGSVAGENATVIVEIDSRATETLNITVDKYYEKAIGNGVIILTTDKLENGTYTIIANYTGDKNFTKQVVTHEFTTNKTSDYILNITTGDINVGELTNITVKVPGDAKGIVIVNINGTNYTATIKDGEAVFNNQTNLGAGRYNITAYFGNNKYANKTATGVFTINKLETPIEVSVDPIKVGDEAVITVTVPAGLTENVTIEIDGVKYNKSVTGTTVVFNVPINSNGTRTVAVSYGGDDRHVANSTTAQFNVTKRNSQVNVTATGANVDGNALIEVQVQENATGYVTVDVNGTNYTIQLNNVGYGSVQIKGLGNGTYYVHATYLGDDQYKPITNDTETFVIAKLNTAMGITVESIDYGAKANITVTVTPDATGFITIRINETRNITLPIGNGKVNWIVDGLAADNYTVYANYSGDGRYNVNNTNKVNRSFEVRQVTPVITIETVEVSSARNATVVVHITPGTTGNINITVNGENYSSPIENGVAKIVIKQLNVGNYTVIANYSGDRNFTNASTTQINKVNVHKFACYDMNVTAPDTKVGVNTTIVVNVPEDATGNVSIYVNGSFAGNATINHGVATLSLNKIIAGKYVVNATFGDAKYANKTVTTNFHVIKWDTPMNITVADAKVGDTVKVIVSVPKEIAGGTATIEINGKKYTNVTDNKGNATFYVADLTYGNKTVVAIYEGNNKYVFNSTTQNFTVTKRSSQVNVTASATVVGMDAIVNVTIPANATGYVIVNVNGTNYTVNTTNGNGSIVIKNLENGKYIVNVTYIGDDQYLSSTNGTDFTILRIQPTFSVNGTDITYGAKELIKFESVESITAPIKVEINGRNYTAFIIEGKGNLTVENLAAGNYNVTIYFAGNDKYMNATANNTFTVEKGVMPIYVIAQNITYSEESLFTIYVNATGKVDIFIFNATDGDMVTAFGNIDIVNYEYVLPVFLDAGNYTVRVDYKGNANYTDSSAKANFTVFKKDPTIAIEVQNITYGGVEHIIVRVNAEGNVTIKVNGTEETIVLREDDNAVVILRAVYNTLPNYNGKAHEYIYNLNVGEYPVEVTFNGNENYNRATANARFFVNTNSTTVNVDVDDIAAGGKETINVTISNKNATGNVTINVDGVNYTRPVTNGTANLTLTNLAAGNHSVVVIYEGDNNFRGNWTSAIFNVTKVKPTITIDVNDTSAGKVAKIIINLPDNATGFVVIDVDGTKYHADIVPGQEIALEVDNLLNKTYHVTAEYSGDEYWDTADNSSSFNVNITKADISVKVENITVGDMAIINITAPKELNGNVTVNVDGKNYTVYVAGGNGILVVPGLDVGNYTVNVTFAGTDRFGPSNTTAKLEVSKVNVTSDDIKVIDQGNGTVVVVVGGNATGNVTVYVDGKNFTGEIVNGTAVITLENVNPGVNDIEVVYSGDDKHSNSTVNGTVTIPRLDTEFAVTVDEGKEGENTTITVKVPKDTTGNVTVTIDGQKYTAEIDNGTAVITVENLTAGNKTAIIEYAGDANYTSNYTTVNFTVGNAKAVPELVVVDHGNGTVVVVVGDNATGNVTIKVGDNVFNATVVNGTAVVQVGNLTPGVNDVEVIYSGDDTHTNSTVNTTIIGPKYDTPFVVNVTEVTEGETATITVKVPENATGNVTVTFDGQKYSAEIVNGTATIPISNLTAGDKSLIVEYAGDDNYASNYTIGNFTVDEAKVVPDMKVIDQGNGTVVVVVGDNATGNVTVKVDGKEYNATVVNGTAVVTLDGNVTPGTHEIEVIYSGDDTHNATSTDANITAPKYDTPIDLEIGEAKEGENTTITVKVPEGTTGDVVVSVGGKNYTAPIENGKAVVTVDDLTPGNHTIAVEYFGDDNYVANYTIGNLTVVKAKETPDMKVIDQGNGTVVVVVGDNATGNVTVKVGDKEYNATVVNGTAVVQLDGNVTPGTHEVEVIYSGDDTHDAANATSEITAPKYDAPIEVEIGDAKEGEPTVITVKVPENATGNVTVSVGGKDYTVPVEDGKAVVTVDNLTDGDHTIAVVYSGDDNYVGNSSVGNLTVEKALVNPDVKVIDQGNGTVVVVVGDNATGNVTIKVGDKEYNATVVNGTAVVQLDGNVTPGTHEIEVIYSGDDTHNATSTDANITAPKYDTPIDLEIGEAKEGENTTITVKVPEGTTGDVVVSVGGKNYTAPIENGKAVVTVDDLSPGNHTIAIEYFGDDNYIANYTVGNLTVDKAKVVPDMKIIDQGNGTVVVVVGDNATGNVTIKVGDKEYNATVVNGTAVVQLDGNVTPGTHEVEIIYSGDDTHDAANATSEITAPKYDAPIEVEIGDAKEGESVTVTVTVPDDATGNVTVSVGGKDYTVPVENGKAVVTVDNLTDGDHTIAVKYSGDDNYAGNSSVGNLTVVKAKETPDMKVIDQGNGTVVVVVGDNATGNVTIKVGDKEYNATVVNGTAVVQLDGNVTPGDHEVEIIYSGDDTHEAANTTSVIKGAKLDTPLDITVENIKVGDKETIVVNVPEGVTGSITIEIDGETYTAPIEDGKATFSVENLDQGKKSVFVKYDGDENYNANTTTAQFEVDKRPTEVTATVEDIHVGETLKVTVKLPENATGQVLIDIDGVGYYVNITNGTGVAEIPHLTNGVYDVNVTYTGDDQYMPSHTSATFKVEKIESFVIPMATNIMVGENENIKLLVPNDATGNVTVIIDGEEYNFNLDDGTLTTTEGAGKYTVAVSGGNGQLVISGLPKGEYYVSVRYNGDEKYLPATNTTLFTVSKIDTKIDEVDQGNGTLVIKLPEDATGNVTVKIGDETFTAKVENGTAVINLENATPGVHEAEIYYSGDNNYASKTDKITVEVPKYNAPIDAAANDINVGETVVIVVNVPQKATGTVTVEVDGKSYTGQIKDGKAEISIPDLTAGDKTAHIEYGGDDNYLENSTSVSFTVSKVKSTISASGKDITAGKDEVITVNVPKDAIGQVLVEINGVGYYGDIVNGVAKVIVPKLAAGKYTAKVTYGGDGKYLENSTTVKFTVEKAKSKISATGDEIMVGDDATVTIKLPTDATGIVTITIDGKTYTAQVFNGKAIVSIPGLAAGTYKATVVYSGDDKYGPTTTVTYVVVNDNNNGTNGNGSNEITLDVSEGGVSLSDYPTGNPLWILLLVLLTIGSNEIRRRFRK